MQISQLECFLAVEKHRSMNIAAQTLFCSQSKVSNSIKDLENELGKPLFVRTNKGVQPTAFAKELVPFANAIISQVGQLKNLYKQDATSRSSLRICANHFGFTALAAADLYNLHADEKMRLTIRDCSRTECLELVSNGYAEIAIIRIWNYQQVLMRKQLQSQDLEFYPLCILPIAVAVGPKNPLFYNESGKISHSDLNSFPAIGFDYAMFNPNAIMHEIFPDFKTGNMISVTSNLVVNTLLNATDAYYLTCGNSGSGENNILTLNGCRILEFTDCDIMGHMGYIKRSGQNLSPLAKEYLEIATGYLQ